MPKKRSPERVAEVLEACCPAILNALSKGADRYKQINFPEGFTDTETRLAMAELKEKGHVVQVGKKRGAKYYLPEKLANLKAEQRQQPEPRQSPKPKAPESLEEPDALEPPAKPDYKPHEKIGEFIKKMKPGMTFSRSPRDMALKFANAYGFELTEAWDEILKACRGGKLQTYTKFDNGFRLHCYKEHPDGKKEEEN